MLHGILMRVGGEFNLVPMGDRERRLECIHIDKGEILVGEVRCRVNETTLTEVADIALADGTGILHDVPCRSFQFLDRQR